MAKGPTLQSQVLGEILPDIGRRHRGTGANSDAYSKAAVLHHLASGSRGEARALARNAMRVPQSVVKRVRNGGTKTSKELKRQLEYVTRDDAVQASWMNIDGSDRRLFKNSIETQTEVWVDTWRGAPQRGHTDHIILSFPKGTDVEAAEAIAREWGQQIFASGDFGDQWRYIAAVHDDKDHVHAHFVVDKRGQDHGRFLSISMKSELNYDVMRERHAEIAQEHGVALNATSRLSRGIIEYPPRETEAANAIHEGRAPELPQMSLVERMKREATVRGFASRYQHMQSLASMADETEDDGGFMNRLTGMFTDAAASLSQGVSLMTDNTTLSSPIDPSERLAQAQQHLVNNARETWAAIQQMDPSAEKTAMEAEFASHTRELQEAMVSEPFFNDHAQTVAADQDPYSNDLIQQLQEARGNHADGSDAAISIDTALSDIRDQLEQGLAERAHELEAIGTAPEEMAERFMLQDRSVGQLEAWQDAGYNTAIGSEIPENAAAMVEEHRDQIISDAAAEGREVDWADEQAKAEQYLHDTHRQDRAEFAQSYGDTVDQLGNDASRIIDDYDVPRDLQETLARDQLIHGEQYQRLADVPAIEAIVERMSQDLSPEDLQSVRDGDASALREEIKDPSIRAAVASELRNEADLSEDAARQSEPVEQFQSMARQHDAPSLERKPRVEPDVTDDYGL